MVNTESFIRRLEKLLEYYAISASAFADAIGVQRSGLSHLLSGRNKPSLDFVLKIVETYPEVDLYWLLQGKGSFPIDKSASAPTLPAAQSPAPSSPKDLFSPTEEQQQIQKQHFEDRTLSNAENLKGDIERIVIFYKDGTFTSYNQK